MADSFYFQHDENASNDDKLLALRAEFGWEGVGLFWALLENMSRNDGYIKERLIGGLSLGYGVAKDTLKELLNLCVEIELFKKDDEGYFSDRMLSHLEVRKKLKESGKRGAAIRWGNRGANGGASRGGNSTKRNETKQNKTKRSKKNIIKEKIPPSLKEVEDYCNERNNGIDPEAFIAHYEANGWKRGKTKVKSWKACIITWEKNREKERKAATPRKKFTKEYYEGKVDLYGNPK